MRNKFIYRNVSIFISIIIYLFILFHFFLHWVLIDWLLYLQQNFSFLFFHKTLLSQRSIFLTVSLLIPTPGASQVVLVVKNLPANVGDMRDTGSIHLLGRSPEGGNGNPLQYSCLENPMDRGSWKGVMKSQM